MARPAKFTSDEILAAAGRLVAEHGPNGATVAAIARELGASSGSIYHRFESRDLIFAQLWIRTVKCAQKGFLEALEIEDSCEAATRASLYILRWSREHTGLARLLLLHRREELIEQWPEKLGDELGTLNSGLQKGLRQFSRRLFQEDSRASLRRVTLALVDLPYAAARSHLAGGEAPPLFLDDMVAKAARCILSLETPR